jgi:hypothetical protein
VKRPCRLRPIVFCCCLLFIACPSGAAAGENSSGLSTQWGGYLRAIGTTTDIGGQSIYQFTETGTYYDGQAEMRLKNETFFGSQWSLETHYEAVITGGDTQRNDSELRSRFGGQAISAYIPSAVISDKRRFFDLTHTLIDNNDIVAYHRLDRLDLTYTPTWGSLRIGRQALTWGNGMVFNPMDLFNPFAPTAVVRDYKVGDDMILGQVYLGPYDGQLLCVPRRDPVSGALSDSQSSYAGKLHLSHDDLGADIMAARHYDDDIAGLGATGTLGGAAWRMNLVYTSVSKTYQQSDFLQVVANMDYAWQWGGKNVYGLLEFFYNGLGAVDDYNQELQSAYVSDRLSRGDLFTLGRYYLAALLQIELHPLLHNDWTVIVNLEDPSGLVQPQLLWDVATNLQLILGVQWHWGAGGSEYGGFDTSFDGQTVNVAPFDQAYLWLTYSF